jgi:hypothetical protein
MKIVRTVVFPGPSVYWRKPVIATGVDFENGTGRAVLRLRAS